MASSQPAQPEGERLRIWRALGLGAAPPRVTLGLIAACLLVYLAEFVAPQLGNMLVFAPVVGEAQPYRFLSSAFLHGGFWHIVLNMYALALVGAILEPALGWARFLGLYLLSALAGNVFVLLAASPSSTSWVTGTAGASGAVFGLFGALLVMQRSFGANTRSMFVIIAANFALDFLPGMHLSWQSHAGGLIAGMLLTAYLVRVRHWARHQSGQLATANRLRSLDGLGYALTLAILLILIALGYR